MVLNRYLQTPVRPNDGLVLFCGANETVSVVSSPFLDESNGGCDTDQLDYEFNSPAGWNWTVGVGNVQNIVVVHGDNDNLVSPSSVTNGNNGTIKVSAIWSTTNWPAYGLGYSTDKTSTALLWVGAPSAANGQVNGSSYSGGVLYVPSGYATLTAQMDGATGANWTVTNGSGSLSPSFNYCSVSWSGFIRVEATATNRCGNGGSYTFYLTTESGYYGYRIAPNPAKDKLSLLLDYDDMAGFAIQSVSLMDSDNKPWYTADTDQLKRNFGNKKSIDIATKNFPRGTYFLHVEMGGKTHKKQIILE